MINKKRIIVGISVLAVLSSPAQDIHFSQYDYSSLTLNPAITAAYKEILATIQHKEQWRVVDAYRTSAVSLEMKLNQRRWTKIEGMTETYKKKLLKGLAFGLRVVSDNAGDGVLKQTQADLSVAYHAMLNTNNMLSAGLTGGFAQRSLNAGGLRWNNQYSGGMYDPTMDSGENFSQTSYGYGDYGAGILWSYGEGSKYLTANNQKHVNVGVSLAHLTEPSKSFINGSSDALKRKLTVHSHALIGIQNTNFSLCPSFLYLQQGPLKEITLGMLIKCKLSEESKYTGAVKGAAISAGCYYRNKDAVIPWLLIEMDKYSLGLSYDSNISGLSKVTSGRGGLELMLRFVSPTPFLYQNKARL